MKKSEFQKYVSSRIAKELPEYAKYKGLMNLDSEIRSSIGVPAVIDPAKDPKISKSLLNHFEKLIEDLKNTSKKKLSTPCALCETDYLKPIDQQFEVYKAIKAFLAIAITRDKHGIRNAYISFSRQRKQVLVKSEWNPEGARRGRPNLYTNETYRYVVNRAAKIKKAKKARNG